MIKDHIKYRSFYADARLQKAFEVLEGLQENTPVGKYQIAENAWITVSEIKKKQEQDFLFEAHRKYLDIHYVISGEERMAYASLDVLAVCKSYDADGDYELLQGTGDVLTLKKGDFCIVYPQDAHVPTVDQSPYLKKAVVKILL